MSDTVFTKVDYDLGTLVKYIELGEIGLPDIQRPFVWKNAKVRDLFDSKHPVCRDHSGIMVSQPKLLPLGSMAHQLRVTVKWLRNEAEAGRVPHLKAGNRLLFDPETVERLLLERARASDRGEDR